MACTIWARVLFGLARPRRAPIGSYEARASEGLGRGSVHRVRPESDCSVQHFAHYVIDRAAMNRRAVAHHCERLIKRARGLHGDHALSLGELADAVPAAKRVAHDIERTP